MAIIHLHRPVPGSDRLERLALAPGRHLGEDEFDRSQQYLDARLEALLVGSKPGILRGLEVDAAPVQAHQAGLELDSHVTVRPGLAVAGSARMVGLYYPLTASWRELVDDYLRDNLGGSAAGVFYLVLRRNERRVDVADSVDPCQRGEHDPRRDTRLLALGSLQLRRLALDATVLPGASPEQIQNHVAARHVDGAILKALGNGVPLALLGISATGDAQTPYAVDWFSQAAGRYPARDDSGYLVLAEQVQEALRRYVGLHRDLDTDGTGPTLAQFLSTGLPSADIPIPPLNLDYLPAAGQLPLELLQNPDAALPTLGWLPGHLAIDMVPVPEEAVPELLERHLARRVVDLRRPAGDHLRLLLAVNEPDYRPDLLDFPQADAVLESDLFRYFMRAHECWRSWKVQFLKLYHLLEGVNLSESQMRTLGLPAQLPPPGLPGDFYQDMIAEASVELLPPGQQTPPYPYDGGPPTPPAFYTDWLVPDPADAGSPGMPPDITEPSENGLVVQYALTEFEIERLQNQYRALQSRLQKTRDYLLLQRQQLDAQTVSLAALAGGVAGDGSGLRMSRWLPFATLEAAQQEDGGEAPPSPRAAFSGGRVVEAQSSRAGVEFNATGIPGREAVLTMDSGPEMSTSFGTVKAYSDLGARYAKGFESSRLEYAMRKDRLDQVTVAASGPSAEPAFEVKREQSFGVIGRVLPDVNEYKHAFEGMNTLKQIVGDLFPDEAVGLREKLQAAGQIREPDNAGETSVRYQQLFKAGKVLVKQIDVFEARHSKLERQLQDLAAAIRRQQGRLRQLGDQVIRERGFLDGLNSRRLEQLGDYGVAQALVRDDWRQVHDRNLERSRILGSELRGLYFVRVRGTPVSASLADPLSLRYAQSTDLVPGCSMDEDVELSADLEQFFDAVLEVPVREWRPLRPLLPKLPAPHILPYIYELRQARFTRRSLMRQPGAGTPGKLFARLQPLVSQNQSVLKQWATLTLPVNSGSSLKRYFHDSAGVLSLEDMAAAGSGRLRQEAQNLRDRLEHGAVCILENLQLLQPSIRLRWAQSAEDDRLAVDRVSSWPGLEQAEQAEFNAVRTLAELVDWWFRQLDANASATALSAMRNMIRATLIVAALGDPREILHGNVHVPPRRFRVGEPLRLTLNRAVRPGTRLQLMDVSQRVVGMLSVEDQDDKGVVANVVRVDQSGISVDTRFTVVASGRTRLVAR